MTISCIDSAHANDTLMQAVCIGATTRPHHPRKYASPDATGRYSHSIVAGGFELMS